MCKTKQKEYEVANIEYNTAKKKEKFKCNNCSSEITINNLTRHMKSKKCMNYKPAE